VLIRRLGKSEPAEVRKNALLRASRVTLENLDVLALGAATFDNCLVNGRARPAGSQATGADRRQLIREIVPSAYQAELARP
jgi:hypothetical protein